MNVARLLRLADLLERDAKKPDGIKFDMGFWGVTEAPINVHSCGTTCCAVGLAALSGEFKDDGLYATIAKIEAWHGRPQGGETHILHFMLDGKNREESGIPVAEEFFDLSNDEVVWLFHPDGYGHGSRKPVGAEGELRVAQRIRDFVDEKSGPYRSHDQMKYLEKKIDRLEAKLRKVNGIILEVYDDED